MIIIRQFATLHPRRMEWNWPISFLNDSQFQGKGGGGEGPWGVKKNKTFPGEACSVPPTHLPPRSVRLGRSFRKSVSIYPTSALRHLNQSQGPWVMVQCQQNLWILIFFSLVSPNRCSSALKESFYNLQYSECKENLKF